LLHEGVAALEDGASEVALKKLALCMELEPARSTAVLWRMARAHANLGDLERAKTCCLKALEDDPLLADAYYTLALVQIEAGEVDDAFAALRKTLYLDGDYVLANFAMANLLEQRGRHRYAFRYRAAAARQVARIGPDDPVPGSDGLTGERLSAMLQATVAVRDVP